MTLPRPLRVPSLLLLMLLLVAGPLAAATSGHRPRGAGPSGPSITGALSQAWAFVIWTKAGSSTDPFGKAGNSIDPFGKAGSGVDPFGKEGNSIDPFGKAGSGIDPFGNPTPAPGN